PLGVGREEVEDLVLLDGAAQAAAALLVAERRNRTDRGADARRDAVGVLDRLERVEVLADPALVATVEEPVTADPVRAAPRDDVHAAAREAALPHVVRRDEQLELLDGVEADRLRAGLTFRRPRCRQPEDVVVDRAVNLDVVVAVVAA